MKNISAGTIARTIVLALALLNQVLVMIGKSPLNIADDDVATALSLLFTIVSTVVAWWKNNSFTQAAIQADYFMNILKSTETGIEIEENEIEVDEQTRIGTETDVE